MTDIATTPTTTPTRVPRTAVAGAATAVGVAVFFALHDGAGIDLAVRAGTEVDHVGPVAVAVTSAGSALAGWGLLALLERVTGRARPIWTIIAAVVFVVSLLGPAGGVGTSAKLGLAALHLAVAVVVIVGLARTARKARP